MFIYILVQYALFSVVVSMSQHPVLIVVSYDAFRYNYFERKGTPFMEKLRKEGTYAERMINVFPTKTFPNHHSIATGLYTETHGVVGNSFYDPLLKQILTIANDIYHYNEDIVPIWTLNERLGNGRYSGSMMWPGAKLPYQGKKITYIEDWDPNMRWELRVNKVIDWIKNPDKPANLVMLYIEEPDTSGHVFGPESDVVLNLLKRLDNLTQYLDEQIKANKLQDIVNVIHLSDHGMVGVARPNIIDITPYLTPDTYEITDTSPCLHIIPNGDKIEETYVRLKNASIENGHFKVYKKNEIPNRWHFKNNRRTPPIFLLAEKGYGFQDLTTSEKEYASKYHITLNKETRYGVHGYDNEMLDMQPFFMARGPKIKKSHKVPPFHTVDLYNLFCDILGVKPVPNNGTFANVKDILVAPSPVNSYTPLGVAVGAVVIALLLISFGSAITLLVIKRQQNITTTAALNKRFPQTFSNASIEAQHLLEPEDA